MSRDRDERGQQRGGERPGKATVRHQNSSAVELTSLSTVFFAANRLVGAPHRRLRSAHGYQDFIPT
jgi:hypothetical protein